MKDTKHELKTFYILWSTQSLSQLGSAITNFALTLWLYEATGSALETALLSICSYGPYVLMSIFAGALSDRWNKKRTMLVCDTLAACCSAAVLLLLRLELLRPAHLYVLNALNGLMNTVQQPAGEVAMTRITPRAFYQKTSGLRSFSQSLVTILHPVLATTLFAFGGMDAVIAADLTTFGAAFLALLFFIAIPESEPGEREREPFEASVRRGLRYLKEQGLIRTLILFLAAVNLVASAFDAALPAYILPRENGGETVLGLVTACGGIATLAGSLIATVLPKPRDRVRVIVRALLLSLCAENFLLAFARTPLLWCAAQIMGWLPIPFMNANMDVVFRSTIPAEMQGRVYACRNSLQFFTIPVGYFLGGLLIDRAFEPVMMSSPEWMLVWFGAGQGAGAALMMLVLGVAGTATCLIFKRLLKKYTYKEN